LPGFLREFRPDILGTVSVGHDGGAWTMAIYFTSEQAAREGEQKQPPPQMQEMMKGDGRAHHRRTRLLRPQASVASRPELTRPARSVSDRKLWLAWT
jgi:hypothetical protein